MNGMMSELCACGAELAPPIPTDAVFRFGPYQVEGALTAACKCGRMVIKIPEDPKYDEVRAALKGGRMGVSVGYSVSDAKPKRPRGRR